MATWFFGPGSWLTRLGMWILGPLRVEGLEHVPRQGAFILVANHLQLLDPLIIGATAGDLTGRVIHFMAKAELRRWFFIGWLASQSGVYFVRRGEGDRAAQRLSLELLAQGRPLAMFPEGHRSPDGKLQAGRNGAALLAMRAGVPLVPVGITGTRRLFRSGLWFWRQAPVRVRIGEPFSIPHQAEGRLDRHALSSATDRIMRESAALLPDDQRGQYAT